MSVEKTFKSKAGDLTLRRPHYKAFRNIARKVAALLEVEFDQAMEAPEFEDVLAACVVQSRETLDDWLGKADYAEAAKLWDAVISFCEFDGFFAERLKQRSESSKAIAETQAELQAAQIAAMKKSGLLPESFSLENVIAAGMAPLNLNPMLSSSTTTPVDTDGTGEPSN